MKKRMLKKGFTLIEILAAILILVIVLVIAVPYALKLLNNAKKESAENSAKGIDDSAENLHINEIVEDSELTDVVFECDGISCSTLSGIELEFNGEIPTQGKIMIDNNGKVFYLENLVVDDLTCYKQVGGDFNCTDEEKKYKAINSIEDLVDFAIEVDNGNDYKDGLVDLARSLDFYNNDSYINPNTTSYGDINKNNIVEGLKTELTTGQGFNPIGELITSARAAAILAMNKTSLEALLPAINAQFDICAYYGCTSLANFASWYEQPELATEIIELYIKIGTYTEQNDYYRNFFSGTFDGNGYKITNIYINKPNETIVGLFDSMEDSTITNINITGTAIARSYVGLLVGECDRCTLKNITSTANVTSTIGDAGGLIGDIYNSTMTDLTIESVVKSNGSWVGGLIAYTSNSTITNCNSISTVTSENYNVGGLIGTSSSSIVTNSNSTSVVSSTVGNLGGLIGYAYNTTIDGCGSKTTATSADTNTGGLIGITIGGKVTNSNSDSTVVAQECWTGGLIGYVYRDTLITNSYAKGSVRGTCNVGGLIGMLNGTASNSYSNASVTGTDGHVGGLIGMIGCTNCNHSIIGVKDCYSTGNVTSVSETGGLIGQNGASSENSRTKYALIKNSYSLGNVIGTSTTIGGLTGTNVMNIENSYAKGNAQGVTVGNLIGNPENSTYTMTNTYSISTQVLTGTATIRGQTVVPGLVVLPTWWRDTLNLGTSFKYEDGYYPLLYRLDDNGNITNELLDGQIKIPTP